MYDFEFWAQHASPNPVEGATIVVLVVKDISLRADACCRAILSSMLDNAARVPDLVLALGAYLVAAEDVWHCHSHDVCVGSVGDMLALVPVAAVAAQYFVGV